MVGALFDDALADNLPLKRLVEANVTQEVLDAIAEESRKGRMLLVGTTDLDAQRSVYWNLTLMAESRHPQALALIQKILVASAAIPGELPPAMIDVEVQGQRYQEMHVDGGTTQQVFMLPPELVITNVARRERTIYVIRNSRMAIESFEVPRDALAIAGRAVTSLIHTQGIGNLYEIAAQARRDGAHFRLAYIPDSFDHELSEAFDRQYMNELFLVVENLPAIVQAFNAQFQAQARALNRNRPRDPDINLKVDPEKLPQAEQLKALLFSLRWTPFSCT